MTAHIGAKDIAPSAPRAAQALFAPKRPGAETKTTAIQSK